MAVSSAWIELRLSELSAPYEVECDADRAEIRADGQAFELSVAAFAPCGLYGC